MIVTPRKNSGKFTIYELRDGKYAAVQTGPGDSYLLDEIFDTLPDAQMHVLLHGQLREGTESVFTLESFDSAIFGVNLRRLKELELAARGDRDLT